MADVVPARPCLHGVRASSAVSRAASSETLKFPFASVGGRRLLGAAFLPPAKESGMSDKHEKARRIVEGEIEEYARDRDG